MRTFSGVVMTKSFSLPSILKASSRRHISRRDFLRLQRLTDRRTRRLRSRPASPLHRAAMCPTSPTSRRMPGASVPSRWPVYGSSVTKLASVLIATTFVIRGSVAARAECNEPSRALADHDDFARDGLPSLPSLSGMCAVDVLTHLEHPLAEERAAEPQGPLGGVVVRRPADLVGRDVRECPSHGGRTSEVDIPVFRTASSHLQRVSRTRRPLRERARGARSYAVGCWRRSDSRPLPSRQVRVESGTARGLRNPSVHLFTGFTSGKPPSAFRQVPSARRLASRRQRLRLAQLLPLPRRELRDGHEVLRARVAGVAAQSLRGPRS